MTRRTFQVCCFAVVLTGMLPVLPVAAQEGEDLFEIDPADFDSASSFNVDNEYYALRPGAKYVYVGSAIRDGEEIERKIEFVVTDLIKEINGINATVLWIIPTAFDQNRWAQSRSPIDMIFHG
jgi:hypothetical protein